MLDGRTTDNGIASRMIGRANQLAAAAYVVKMDANGKPMVDEKGQLVLSTDANGKLIETSPEAKLKLRRYVGLLDAVRQISRALDGPIGGGGGSGD